MHRLYLEGTLSVYSQNVLMKFSKMNSQSFPFAFSQNALNYEMLSNGSPASELSELCAKGNKINCYLNCCFQPQVETHVH